MTHENIVKLQGYTIENGYPSIVYGWSEGGTVNDYIKQHPECDRIKLVRTVRMDDHTFPLVQRQPCNFLRYMVLPKG